MSSKRPMKPRPPWVDDFALRAAGLEWPEALSRSGQAISHPPSAMGSLEKAPIHPGFTRRELESLVDGGSLTLFGHVDRWRGLAVVITLALLSWFIIAGIYWTGRELVRWLF